MDSYEVEYHVVQMVYCERGALPSGTEFAELWSGMAAFGEHKATAAFWHAHGKEPSPLIVTPLGSLAHVRPLLQSGAQSICGGGTVVKRRAARDCIRDADFYFAVAESSRWQGSETPSDFQLGISGQWFEQTGVENVLSHMRRCFEILDRRAPAYGFIDLSSSEDTFSGMAYVSTWIQRIPLQRWVEQGNWVYSASQRDGKARSIYWGNYFGPKILERLGGRERFVARFRSQAKLADGSQSARVWEYTNGVFVTLCIDPMGCKPGQPLSFSAMFNLQWLHMELGAAGALCGWCDDRGSIENL